MVAKSCRNQIYRVMIPDPDNELFQRCDGLLLAFPHPMGIRDPDLQ